MSPLGAILARQIAASGPMSLADYMAACLLHPEHGYYTTAEPFGADGDFITAPEISQMFGEMLGLWLAAMWLEDGAPAPITLAEPGPGRGTLMADILRATAHVPGFHAAARVHLVEASPRLAALQRKALGGHGATWAESLAALPDDGPLYLVANEFFDALPIRQFVRAAGRGWHERVVGTAEGGALALALAPAAPVPALAHRLGDVAEGEIAELCPAAPGLMAEIAGRIARHGGAALIVDYGGWQGVGDTLQALAAHTPVGVLERPGQADLTAHVDFAPLAAAARAAGAAPAPLTPQGVFLQRLGITARAQALARGLSGPALEQHVAAHRRLTHPHEMGNLFKVLALRPEGRPPPAGVAA